MLRHVNIIHVLETSSNRDANIEIRIMSLNHKIAMIGQCSAS